MHAVGFQKLVTHGEQWFHATRSYSLIKPCRTGRRLMRSLLRSATGWVGRGGRKVTGTVGSTVVVANVSPKNVFPKHYPQMLLTEDQHAIGEFSSDGADEPFSETVRLRATGRNPDLWGSKSRLPTLSSSFTLPVRTR